MLVLKRIEIDVYGVSNGKGKYMNGVVKEIVVTLGEPVTANSYGEEYDLTPDKKYIVKKYDGDCIMVQNNKGEDEWYSLDYFREFYDRFSL